MTMSFSYHENIEISDLENSGDISSSGQIGTPSPRSLDLHLFLEKLRIPEVNGHLSRPRLNHLLKKSLEQFGATFITGRAGTGKTVLAADFARRFRRVAWYSVESADNTWDHFSRYFAAGFSDTKDDPEAFLNLNRNLFERSVPHFIDGIFSGMESAAGEKDPLLIVLDDVHNIFDCEWFGEFFNTLIYSLTPSTQLLLLSRSQPSVPLWRLRSKQVLGVIDEKLLSFNLAETIKLFSRHGVTADTAQHAYIKSFGRISKIRVFLDLYSSEKGKKG